MTIHVESEGALPDWLRGSRRLGAIVESMTFTPRRTGHGVRGVGRSTRVNTILACRIATLQGHHIVRLRRQRARISFDG